jgi:hypothetical protein
MHILTFLLGPGIFFTPLIYVPLYLYIERNFSHHAMVQYILKILTVLGGLFLVFYACTTPLDFKVLMPSAGGPNRDVPAAIFLVILGIAAMTLPLYSKYIKFSNRNN